MFTITKEFTFSAAHRLEGHPKCGRLHGHNYTVLISVGSSGLTDDGMVMDFSDLKQVYNDAVHDKVDHRYMVSVSNMDAGDVYASVAPKGDVCEVGVQHTTAEELAAWIAEEMTYGLQMSGRKDVFVLSVRLWETPTSYATHIAVTGGQR